VAAQMERMRVDVARNIHIKHITVVIFLPDSIVTFWSPSSFTIGTCLPNHKNNHHRHFGRFWHFHMPHDVAVFTCPFDGI